MHFKVSHHCQSCVKKCDFEIQLNPSNGWQSLRWAASHLPFSSPLAQPTFRQNFNHKIKAATLKKKNNSQKSLGSLLGLGGYGFLHECISGARTERKEQDDILWNLDIGLESIFLWKFEYGLAYSHKNHNEKTNLCGVVKGLHRCAFQHCFDFKRKNYGAMTE